MYSSGKRRLHVSFTSWKHQKVRRQAQEGSISIRVKASPLTESVARLPMSFLMDYLRSGTREQNSDHRPFLKSCSLDEDLGSGQKLGKVQMVGRAYR